MRFALISLLLACSTSPRDSTTTEGGEVVQGEPDRESNGDGDCAWEVYQPPVGCGFNAAEAGDELTDLAAVNRLLHAGAPNAVCQESMDLTGKRIVIFQVVGNGLHNLSDLRPQSVVCGNSPTVTIRQDAWCGGTEPDRAFLVLVMPAGAPVGWINVGQSTCNHGDVPPA